MRYPCRKDLHEEENLRSGALRIARTHPFPEPGKCRIRYRSRHRAAHLGRQHSPRFLHHQIRGWLPPGELSRPAADGQAVVVLDKALDDSKTKDFVAELESDPAIEYVEPDLVMHATATPPNDTHWDKMWDLKAEGAGLGLLRAWDVTKGWGARVAVLDTGITRHPDLDANVISGYDFVSDAGATIVSSHPRANGAILLLTNKAMLQAEADRLAEELQGVRDVEYVEVEGIAQPN